MLGGVATLADYALGERRDSGQLFGGVVALLIGAFFFLFTLNLPLPLPGLQDGVQWADMGRLWPMFVLIVGLGALAQWATDPGNRAARSLSLLALLIAVVALIINFSLAGDEAFRQLARFWPLLLVIAGLWMLLGLSRRTTR
jgi:hypothetical protein